MSKITDGEDPIVDGALDVADRPQSRKATRTGKAAKSGQIDIQAALEAPIKVRHDGTPRPVPPYEAILRQHFRKSLVDKSIASVKYLIGQAETYQVIKTPPPSPAGGVFTVPKGLPEEVERAIFEFRPEANKPEPMSRIFAILKRYFDARRK